MKPVYFVFSLIIALMYCTYTVSADEKVKLISLKDNLLLITYNYRQVRSQGEGGPNPSLAENVHGSYHDPPFPLMKCI